jgi:hypothetical protein
MCTFQMLSNAPVCIGYLGGPVVAATEKHNMLCDVLDGVLQTRSEAVPFVTTRPVLKARVKSNSEMGPRTAWQARSYQLKIC